MEKKRSKLTRVIERHMQIVHTTEFTYFSKIRHSTRLYQP